MTDLDARRHQYLLNTCTQYLLSLVNNCLEIPLFSRKKVKIYVCFCSSLPISQTRNTATHPGVKERQSTGTESQISRWPLLQDKEWRTPGLSYSAGTYQNLSRPRMLGCDKEPAMQTEILQLCGIARTTAGHSRLTQRTCTFLQRLTCCLQCCFSPKQDKAAAIMVAQTPIPQITHQRLRKAEIFQPLTDKIWTGPCTSGWCYVRQQFSTAIHALFTSLQPEQCCIQGDLSSPFINDRATK